MGARTTSKLLASAILRRVHAEGGSAMLLAKGDETSGALLVLCAEKGQTSGLFERSYAQNGCYQWVRIGPQDIADAEALNHYLQRRRQHDPDLWLLELDIPNAERFIEETGVAD